MNLRAFMADTLVGLRELLIEDASAGSFTPYDEQATAVALDRQELRGWCALRPGSGCRS
jgi:hypothetical protein